MRGTCCGLGAHEQVPKRACCGLQKRLSPAGFAWTECRAGNQGNNVQVVVLQTSAFVQRLEVKGTLLPAWETVSQSDRARIRQLWAKALSEGNIFKPEKT